MFEPRPREQVLKSEEARSCQSSIGVPWHEQPPNLGLWRRSGLRAASVAQAAYWPRLQIDGDRRGYARTKPRLAGAWAILGRALALDAAFGEGQAGRSLRSPLFFDAG